METQIVIKTLADNKHVFEAIAGAIAEGQEKWKPADDKWSVQEIFRHLHDEEVYDFRTRVKLMLEEPEARWPKIDPVGWVTERGYNKGEFQDAVQNFLAARKAVISRIIPELSSGAEIS